MKATTRKRKPKTTCRFLPRERGGIGEFLSWLHSSGGLRRAALRVEREQKAQQRFLDFDGKDARVN